MIDILLAVLLVVVVIVGLLVALSVAARTERGGRALARVGKVVGRSKFVRRQGLKLTMRRARLDFRRRGEEPPSPYWLETPDGRVDIALLAPPTAAQLRRLPQAQRRTAEERLVATMRARSQEEAEEMLAPSNRAEQRAMERAKRRGQTGPMNSPGSMADVPPSMRPRRRGRM